MSRNSSGTYTRPSNSFSQPATGTAIDPSAADSLFDDLETEMTDSYSRSIKGGMLVNGTAATPAFTWTDDLNTGMYRIGDGNVGIACDGVKIVDISGTGLSVTGTIAGSGALTAAGVASSGALSGAQAFTLSGDITPTALSGNVDDYNPTGLSTATLLRIDGGASSRNITGLAGGADGLIKVVLNIGATNNLVLKNETTSTAANRFKFGADITLTPDQGALIWYDSTSSRWRCLATFTTAGGGSGTVTSVAGGDGLIGGTITSSGTLSTAPQMRLSNVGLAVSASAGALTIALKGADGNDPSSTNKVEIDFRHATLTTGQQAILSVTAATSLVLSSGSTLGVTSTTGFRLWIVCFNDAGTFRLGAINCSTSSSGTARVFALRDDISASSTAEGGAGAADSAGVIYTGTAVSAKPMRILGYLEWSASGLTAGTWTTTNLSKVQIYGPGVALPGQIVQVVTLNTGTDSSTASSTYQNTAVTANITPTSAANLIEAAYAGSAFTGAAVVAAATALFRGSTQLNTQNYNYSGTGGIIIASGHTVMDGPNSTSSTTYTVKLRNNDNATTVYWPGSAGNSTYGNLILKEIQG